MEKTKERKKCAYATEDRPALTTIMDETKTKQICMYSTFTSTTDTSTVVYWPNSVVYAAGLEATETDTPQSDGAKYRETSLPPAESIEGS